VSQDAEPPPAPDELIDALCLCLSDIETVAYSALPTMREADPTGTVASGIDEARLKGLGDHVQKLRSWVIAHRKPFRVTGIDNTLLLANLNILHADARKIIEAVQLGAVEPPQSYLFYGYLAGSAEIIGLIHEQLSVTNIVFFLKMLSQALGYPSNAMREIAPEPSHVTQPEPSPRSGKMRVFVASSKGARSAAEELALGLPNTSQPLTPIQSWHELPELGTQVMPSVWQTIKQCQYGVLALTPEESTVPRGAKNDAEPDKLHLRLSADAAPGSAKNLASQTSPATPYGARPKLSGEAQGQPGTWIEHRFRHTPCATPEPWLGTPACKRAAMRPAGYPAGSLGDR